MESPRPFRLETLGDLIDRGYGITISCHGNVAGVPCNHHRELDLPALAERIGRDHPYGHDELVPLFRCSKCGGKQLGMTLMAPGVKR